MQPVGLRNLRRLPNGPGGVPIPFNVAVMSYEPTWHAFRIGVEGRLIVDGNWSVSGEIAAIPYAALENKDSHLLRQSAADLGTAPNIITRSSWGYGVAAEIFINYAITANLELGAGARYWGLFSTEWRRELRTGLRPEPSVEAVRAAALRHPAGAQGQTLNCLMQLRCPGRTAR